MTHPIDTSPEAIAALLDGVTPGPWGADNGEGYSANAVKALRPFIKYPATVAHAVGDSAEAEANTRFIAAARELVPAIAAEIARLTAERDEWQRQAIYHNRKHGEMLTAFRAAEAERDEARAQVAMAYEVVKDAIVNALDMRGAQMAGRYDQNKLDFYAVNALTPADATAALARRDAAMRNEGRRQVKVKPLVWDDFDGQGAKASGFYQANYLVTLWRGRGQFEVSVSYPGYQARFDGEPWHSTMESAKAAAQADYEARILAALEPESGE